MSASTPLTQRMLAQLIRDPVPWEVTLEMTKYCNFDCVHCYVPRDRLGVRREMSLAEIKTLLNDFRALGGATLHLTGGEAMVHRNFLEIFRHARSLHLKVQISTNGSRVDEALADEFVRLGLAHLGISLYGATPETAERVTKRKGAFEDTMRGLRLLAWKGIPVNLKLPVMRANLHDLADRVAIARTFGFSFSMDPGMTPKNSGDRSTEAERISKEEIREVAILRKEVFAPFMLPSGRRLVDTGFVPLPEPPQTRAASCNVGLTFCAIDSYGDVFPCIAFPAVAGNVRERPLSEIWRESPLFRRLREAVLADVKGCNTCDVSQTCGRCIGHAYLVDGDMMGPSSLDCARQGKEVPTYFGAGNC